MPSHESFISPTIVEALCEIHFELPVERAWASRMPGEVWAKILDDYPDLEPITELEVEFGVSPAGPQQNVVERKRFRFAHKGRRKLIQLSSSVCSVNILKPYQGWNGFLSDVDFAWKNVASVVRPNVVRRVGLRYINKIARRSADELGSHWFNATDYIPRKPLECTPPFAARIAVRLTEIDRCVVNVGVVTDETKHNSVGLDIDCIRETQLSPDENTILNVADDLHEYAWNIFRDTKNDNLDRHLRGELP